MSDAHFTPAYTSAAKRLGSLPEIFTGSDLTVLFGWTSQTASTYLANWRRAGQVKSLGGRSDVHMNLVKNRNANPELALMRVFPLAIKLGGDVLREAGWTTQIPQLLQVAVPQPGPVYAVTGFELTPRPVSWFRRVEPGILRAPGNIHRLQPAWALADMIARARDARVRNAWLLDPDDLDLAAARTDPFMPGALAAFGLKSDCLTELGYQNRPTSFDLIEA